MRTQHRAPLIAFAAVTAACLLMLFHAIHQISPGLPIPSLLADGPTRVFHELVPGSTLDKKATTETATQSQIEKSSDAATPPSADTDALASGPTIHRSAPAGHRHSATANAPAHHPAVKTTPKQHSAKPPVTSPPTSSRGGGKPSGQPTGQPTGQPSPPTVGVPGLGGVHVPPALGLGGGQPGNSGFGHSQGNGNQPGSGNAWGHTGSTGSTGSSRSQGDNQGSGSSGGSSSVIGFGVRAFTTLVTPLTSAVVPSPSDDSGPSGWPGHHVDGGSPWSDGHAQGHHVDGGSPWSDGHAQGHSDWSPGHPTDGWPHGDHSSWDRGNAVSSRWAPGRP